MPNLVTSSAVYLEHIKQGHFFIWLYRILTRNREKDQVARPCRFSNPVPPSAERAFFMEVNENSHFELIKVETTRAAASQRINHILCCKGATPRGKENNHFDCELSVCPLLLKQHLRPNLWFKIWERLDASVCQDQSSSIHTATHQEKVIKEW